MIRFSSRASQTYILKRLGIHIRTRRCGDNMMWSSCSSLGGTDRCVLIWAPATVSRWSWPVLDSQRVRAGIPRTELLRVHRWWIHFAHDRSRALVRLRQHRARRKSVLLLIRLISGCHLILEISPLRVNCMLSNVIRCYHGRGRLVIASEWFRITMRTATS